jgi:small nuclear ribonucleoprotein
MVRIQLLSEPTSQALENSIGKNVLLRLKGGGGIRGILLGFDTHMNLVLDDAEEIFKDDAKKLGMIVVRGDNIILVSPAE